MSEQDKLQAGYDALVSRFMAPLLRGETVVLEQPFAPGAIAYFEHASAVDGTSDQEVFDLLHRHGSRVARIETVPWPDRDLLLMAMTAYDLLVITDPKLDALFARGAREKVVAWIDTMLEAVAPPKTRASALARHALLETLVGVRRRDVTAKSWAYTYRFKGRPTSSSLLTRPIFGAGFDETEALSDLGAILAEADAQHGLDLSARFRALLARSPVTELLCPEVAGPLRFGLATLGVLSDDGLRGGIAREIAARGEGLSAARLGQALADPLLTNTAGTHLYYALALCLEIQTTTVLDEGPALSPRLSLTDPDSARYAAVLPACFLDETMKAELDALDEPDHRALRERAALLRAALPPRALEEVPALLRHARRPDPRKQETLSRTELSA